MNFLDAELAEAAGGLSVRLNNGTVLPLPAARRQKYAARRDQPVILGVRPEHISRAAGDLRPGLARYAAIIDLVQPTGSRTYGTFQLSGVETMAELQAHDVSQPGEKIELAIDMNRVVLIDPATEKVL
jgi:multiple sugar transport system ATP-binding protein